MRDIGTEEMEPTRYISYTPGLTPQLITLQLYSQAVQSEIFYNTERNGSSKQSQRRQEFLSMLRGVYRVIKPSIDKNSKDYSINKKTIHEIFNISNYYGMDDETIDVAFNIITEILHDLKIFSLSSMAEYDSTNIYGMNKIKGLS